MKNYLNNKDLNTRFWDKVEKKESDECWNWIAGTQSKGYGSFGVGNGKTDLAHRVAFELATCINPDRLCVMHTCDNRLCCNPNHLQLGTIADNNKDMKNKGRQAKGMKNGRSVLTPNNIVSMRSDYQGNEKNLRELSEDYDIHYNTARNAVQGKTWKDLPLAE